MKNLFKILILSLLVFSCNNLTSTNQLSLWVEESIVEEWDKYVRGEYVINELILVHKTGTEYEGILNGKWKNNYTGDEPFSLTVEVTYDGNNFIWEIPELLGY